MLEEKMIDLINQIDSDSPVPGGGSVSALVATLGICLARMYGHLSVNKKKFLALDPTLQESFQSSFDHLVDYKNQLIQAYDVDCEAYDCVMKAYKLPKETSEQQAERKEAILKATFVAIDSPYKIMQKSLEAMKLCEFMIEQGNTGAISDLACGVIFLDAAIQGAGLNVKINLSILDEEDKQLWTNKMNDCLKQSQMLKTNILNQINL